MKEERLNNKDKINNIINKATELKNNGISDLEVAKYVHLKLGNLLIYDNSYTENYIKDSSEKNVTDVTKNRQKMLLEKNTDVSNREQICKGMAEIYAGILDKVGIESRVIGVEKKGQIDGCKQEDGTIYEVAEKYKSSLDDNLNVVNGKNEKNNKNEAKHYYTIVKTEQGEYTQDFLIDTALQRIKTGEASLNDELPGFCKKEEYETKAKVKINELELSQEYIEQIKSEYEKFTDKPSDEKAFEFVFEKIKENNSKFGFEESKDYMMTVGMNLFSKEFNPKRDLKIVNLVKEDEKNCDIASIYIYGENSYLLRGGDESTQIKIPIGRIKSVNIKELQEQDFEPRMNDDLNIFNEITQNNYHNNIELKIGKSTINMSTEAKDKAYDIVLNKVYERTHLEEIHKHKIGSQSEK